MKILNKSLMLIMFAVVSHAYAQDYSVKNEDNVTLYYNDVTTLEFQREVEVVNGGTVYSGELKIPDYISVPNYNSSGYVQAKVVGIGNNAFNRMDITRVKFPKELRYIRPNAFLLCTKMDSLFLPESLQEIYQNAFQYCLGLKYARITASLVMSDAFNGCQELNQVVFSSNVSEVEGAFTKCEKIKKVKLEDGPGEIFFGYGGDNPITDKGAVFYASDLEEVYVGKAYDFNGNISPFTGEARPVLGPDVTAIPPYFYANDTKEEILLSNKITKIGRYAFTNANIKQFAASTELNTICEYALSSCNSLTTADFSAASNTIVMESGVLANCPALEVVHLPNGISSIGEKSFSGCASLRSVDIPATVKTIGIEAFKGCSDLNNLTIPSGVESIGRSAFQGCGFSTVVIPESITSISESAFARSAIESIVIPQSVVEISAYAFKECKKLMDITLGKNVQRIGAGAFDGCSLLEEINLPHIPEISSSMFSNCISLKHVDIPSTVKVLGYGAFWNCKSLESIDLSSIAEIESYSMKNCSNLRTVKFPAVLSGSFVGTFTNCRQLQYIRIPDGIYTIGDSCFTNCERLESVVVSGSVNNIKDRSFDGCINLKKVKFEDADGKLAIENSQDMTVNINFKRDLDPLFKDTSLDSVYIGRPLNLTKVDYYHEWSCSPFMNQENIRFFKLGEKVNVIPSYLATNCHISMLKLSDKVESLSENAFYGAQIDTVSIDAENPPTMDTSVIVGTIVEVPMGVGNAYRADENWAKNLIYDSSDELTVVNVRYAGTLIASMKQQGIMTPSSVCRLKLTGKVGADDLNTIKNEMPHLYELDLSDVGLETIPSSVFANNVSIMNLKLPATIVRLEDYCFSGCLHLIGDFNFPNCEYVGINAFKGTSVSSVSFGHELTIAQGAFRGSSIKNFLIQESCDIGNDAFRGCTQLIELNLPQGIKSIGDYAFAECGISTLVLDGRISSIGKYAFADCTNLEGNIVLPTNLKVVPENLFSGCTSIESVVVSNHVSIISKNVFAGCVNLQQVELPESLTNMGEGVFDGCTKLHELDIPKWVVKMDGALKNTNLKKICTHWQIPIIVSNDTFSGLNEDECTLYVPSNSAVNYLTTNVWKIFWNIEENESEVVKKIVFADMKVKAACVSAWDINGDGELGEDEVIRVTTIGETLKNNIEIATFDELRYFKALTSVEANAFNGCSNLTSLTLPVSVNTVDVNAFNGCPKIEFLKVEEGNITYDSRDNCNAIILTTSNQIIKGCANTLIPLSVKSIGESAFSGCSELRNISIPSNINSIGANCFTGCEKLFTVRIHSDYIWNSISYGNTIKDIFGTQVEEVIAPDFEEVPPYAFSGLSELTKVELSDKYTIINNQSFEGCLNLRDFVLPESITTIGEWAFKNCSKITNLEFPNSLRVIRLGAFEGCSNLISAILPNSITNIEANVFKNCSSLENVVLPVNVTEIPGEMFRNCKKLTKIDIPKNVTSIGGSAFSGTGIREVSLPKTLKTLGYGVFSSCGLEVVKLPASIVEMGNSVFEYCMQLKDIWLEWEESPSSLKSVSLFGTWGKPESKEITLHVPRGTIDYYKKTKPWTGFGTYVESFILGDVNGDEKITAQDASLVQQIVARKVDGSTEGVVYDAADVNEDGNVTAQDASLIQQNVAKMISW